MVTFEFYLLKFRFPDLYPIFFLSIFLLHPILCMNLDFYFLVSFKLRWDLHMVNACILSVQFAWLWQILQCYSPHPGPFLFEFVYLFGFCGEGSSGAWGAGVDPGSWLVGWWCYFYQKAQSNGPEKQDKEGVIQNFKRTLSKKEKKEKKKREKEALRQASDKEERPSQGDDR